MKAPGVILVLAAFAGLVGVTRGDELAQAKAVASTGSAESPLKLTGWHGGIAV